MKDKMDILTQVNATTETHVGLASLKTVTITKRTGEFVSHII
jgi:hypothetical protein